MFTCDFNTQEILLKNLKTDFICLCSVSEQIPTSFYLVRFISKTPCIILRLGFPIGTPANVRNKVLNEKQILRTVLVSSNTCLPHPIKKKVRIFSVKCFICGDVLLVEGDSQFSTFPQAYTTLWRHPFPTQKRTKKRFLSQTYFIINDAERLISSSATSAFLKQSSTLQNCMT